MAMKIYTKTGDNGTTGLFGGTRLPKDHIRIAAYGAVDELNSFVGVLRESIDEEDVRKTLMIIQHNLFDIGSQLATDPQKKLSTPETSGEDVILLEEQIDLMGAVLPVLKNFILPGGNIASAQAHVCRTVCRRAERNVISLSREEGVNTRIIHYLNRLSDYFFTLARYLVHLKQGEETVWKTRS